MKKLSLLILITCLFVAVNAQYTIPADSINGAETVYFKTFKLTKGNIVALQALCTNTGGTTDGTIVVQGSVDGVSFGTLASTAGLFYGYPNDTLTMTDGAVGLWVIENNPFLYIRYKVAGTSGDSTIVAPVLITKN